MTAPPSFTCPRCGRTSYHPDDVRFGYCGNCHAWTGKGARFHESSLDAGSAVGGLTFYDLDGMPISLERWAMMTEHKVRTKGPNVDPADRWWRIGGDYVGPWWVSTVWIGDDMSFGLGGPPLIFETMAFDRASNNVRLPVRSEDQGWHGVMQERYATKEEARAGHERMVKLLEELMATVDEATLQAILHPAEDE